MKKHTSRALRLLILSLVIPVLTPALASAATTNVTGGTNGPLCNSGGYFTPATVTVTSGDTITFSVPSNDPYTGGVQINGFPQGNFVVPRGGSVTTQALTSNVSYQGTWPNSLSCIKGSGTVTVQAPATPPPSSPPAANPPSSSSSTSTTTKSTPTATTKSTTTAALTPSAATPTAAPETVVADTITVNGQKVTSTDNLTIHVSQSMVLSGTTAPNGKITLTIHSNPTTTTVQADSTGKWSYTVQGLPAGNHTIDATVTDPATNQTSAPSKLLAFTVTSVITTPSYHAVPAATTKSKSNSLLYILGAVALLIVIAIIFTVMKMKKKSKTPDQAPQSIAPNTSENTLEAKPATPTDNSSPNDQSQNDNSDSPPNN